MARLRELPSKDKWPLRLGFIFIIAVFGLTNLVSLREMRSNQKQNRGVVEKMVVSVELLSRLDRDLDQKRLLIDAHIFEKQSSEMEDIEIKIAEVDADFAAAADAYTALARETREYRTWEELQAELTRLQPDLAKVIQLSRENMDLEARELMRRIESQFDTVDQAMAKLIDVNRIEANQALAEVATLQRRSRIFLGGLTLSGMAFALFAAVSVSRLLSQRENQLRSVVMQLEERNRDLDAFAGRVAHDLRSPLTTINLAASQLSEREHEAGTSAILQRGVRRMEGLIQDLLTLSSIDAQVAKAVCETARVASVVAEELQPQVTKASGVMHIEVEPATVHCSPGLLRQVLWNLGENAVKYRRSDVRLDIEIRGRAKRQIYEFSVTDNGAGMSEEEARHVFEPFFRGEHVQSTPGTGLGLSIVKRVVEANGGAVSVDSQPGRGTTFDITLPIERGNYQPAVPSSENSG